MRCMLKSCYLQIGVVFITNENHVIGRIWLCWRNETYNVNPFLKAGYLIHCEVDYKIQIITLMISTKKKKKKGRVNYTDTLFF
jgi:hypothetical protein